MKTSWIFLFFFPLLSFAATSPEFIRKNAMELSAGTFPAPVLDILKNKKIIFFGEIHGTNEEPALVGNFAHALTQNSRVVLALEFPVDTQSAVDEFLRTNDERTLLAEDFFRDSFLHMGRGGSSARDLLRSVRANPRISVFCFDVRKRDFGPGRDLGMAQNVARHRERNPDATYVLLAGNRHTRLSAPPGPRPMAEELMKLSRDLRPTQATSILFRAHGGSAWNCLIGKDGAIDCGVHSLGGPPSPYSTAVDYVRYFLWEPTLTDEHEATIFLRDVSASLPL